MKFIQAVINTDTVLQSLKVMGLGMFGIFVVTGVIIGIIVLLNKVTNLPKLPKKDKDKDIKTISEK
ncbi:MAG: hypothetical protein RR248_01970 [Clostridia bacterium]